MHFLRHIAGLLEHAATAFECRQPTAAPSSPFSGVPNQLEQLLRESRTMSEKLTNLEAKVDGLVASEAAAHARVDARDALLVQATKDRDTAITGLAEAQSEVATLKGELAALPAETAAQEARLDAVLTKMDGIKSSLDSMELTPAADPAPSEQPADTAPADTTTEPVPTEAPAPAATDPAAPTGTDTPL